MTDELNPELLDMCIDFLEIYYREDIAELANLYPHDKRSLEISANDVLKKSAALLDDYHEHPEEIQRHMNAALDEVDIPVEKDLSGATVRLTDLNDERTFDVGQYSRHERGELIGVHGQVTQLSSKKLRIIEATYVCQRCGTPITVTQPRGELQEPGECQCGRQGPYKLDEEASEFIDYQLARIKLPPEKATDGSTHIDAHIEDDLVGRLRGNERVTLTGKLRTEPVTASDSTLFEYEFDTEQGTIEVEEDGYDDIELDPSTIEQIKEIANGDPIETLKNSLSPGLNRDSKMDAIAEAIVLQLVGAGRKDAPDGPTYRGDPHILLLGDPGTGKSVFLESVEEVAPRAKLASGESVTKGGVTAAAVKDDFGPTQWSLKAGLLVRANGGIACLDEIDKLGDSTADAMHQALENQRIDVEKAGIEAHLPARTRLLAAGNPKHGRFDPYEPVAEQIDLSPTLMSRFDLMFMIEDQPDPDRDREIAEHITEAWEDAARLSYEDNPGLDSEIVREIDPELYRAYIAYARQRINPVPTADVKETLEDEYYALREQGHDTDSPVPVTARKLEGLLRLAEASARARLSDKIETQDVNRAVRLVRLSLQDVGMDPETGELDADIVEAGASQSQRQRMKTIQTVVGELEDETDKGAPLESIVDQMDEYDREKIIKSIKNLKDSGDIYETKSSPPHYRQS